MNVESHEIGREIKPGRIKLRSNQTTLMADDVVLPGPDVLPSNFIIRASGGKKLSRFQRRLSPRTPTVTVLRSITFFDVDKLKFTGEATFRIWTLVRAVIVWIQFHTETPPVRTRDIRPMHDDKFRLYVARRTQRRNDTDPLPA